MIFNIEDIQVNRARDEHKSYIHNNESLIHNTSFVATIDDNKVVAAADFIIDSFKIGIIDNFSVIENIDTKHIYKEFVDEFLYWNPFIEIIRFNILNKDVNIEALVSNEFVPSQSEDNVYIKKIRSSVELFKIDINQIQPSQLTVSKKKLERVSSWIKKQDDIIVPLIKINDSLVSIDGHTRLLRAYQNGFQYVYGYFEKESFDEELFTTFVAWCHDSKIFKIKDLETKIVSEKDHERLWIARCQSYIKNRGKCI